MELIPIGKIYFKAMVEKLANVTIIEMENEVKISAIEVQKELMKSKVMAKFSHYTSGNMYYTVELESGVYQFPIGTVEKGALVSIETMINSKIIELEKKLIVLNPDKINLVANAKANEDLRVIEIENEINALQNELEKMFILSSDLGTTSFHSEMRGSELNRWIKMAIKNDEFTKIN